MYFVQICMHHTQPTTYYLWWPGRQQEYLSYLPYQLKYRTVQNTKYLYVRVPQCMSPRQNIGVSQPLSRQRVCPCSQNRGGGAHSPAGEGLGDSQFRRLEKKLSTLPTLWSRAWRMILLSDNSCSLSLSFSFFLTLCLPVTFFRRSHLSAYIFYTFFHFVSLQFCS